MNDRYWIKIGKGLIIALGGAGFVYVLGALDLIDVEVMTPLLVALASIIINTIRNYFRDLNDKRKGNNQSPAEPGPANPGPASAGASPPNPF